MAGLTPATVDGSDVPSGVQFAEAMRFRESFQLRRDEEWVLSSLAMDSAFPSAEFGVPLTTGEADEIARRIAVQERATPAFEHASAQPDFAGAYIDQAKSGRPVFVFTGRRASHQGDLEQLLPDVSFDIRIADQTLDELRQSADEAFAEFPSLLDAGVPVASVAPDEVNNTLEFGLAEWSSSAAEVLRERFGRDITLTVMGWAELDCFGYGSCGNPLKGGIRIDRANYNGSGPMCTSGWVGRRESNNALVIVTAGHCLANNDGSGSNIHWKHDSSTFGNAVNFHFHNGSGVDVGIISIDDWDSGEPRNKFFLFPAGQGGTKEVRSLLSKRSNSAQTVGSAVCRSGAKTKTHCGTIHARHANRYTPGPGGSSVQLTNMWVANFDADGGDSGGPYFHTNTAYGIHSSSTPGYDPDAGYGWYTTVDNIDAETGWNICLSAAC